jgi:superfamily II DNA or RNA helicase
MLKNLALELGYSNQILTLTGKESEEERQSIKDSLLELDGFVLFSTIADEALDIPLLDMISLVFPAKQRGLIVQQIGRVERFAPGKPTPIVIDYVDINCGVLKNQAYERNSVYLEKGIKVSRPV